MAPSSLHVSGFQSTVLNFSLISLNIVFLPKYFEFFFFIIAISPYELLSKIWGYVCTEERGPPQDPIMWQLSMMIKFFLFSEEDQNLGL